MGLAVCHRHDFVGDLEHTCPGPGMCHGHQDWCPLCGEVGRVCDSPGCSIHDDAPVEVKLTWRWPPIQLGLCSAEGKKAWD